MTHAWLHFPGGDEAWSQLDVPRKGWKLTVGGRTYVVADHELVAVSPRGGRRRRGEALTFLLHIHLADP